MNLGIEDLDCPQYVSFNSENFEKDLGDTSALSMDSLNCSEHCDSTEKLSVISGDLTTSQCQQSYISEGGSLSYISEETTNMDKENLRKFPSRSESFAVHRPKVFAGNIKPAALKVTVPKPFQFSTDNRIKSKPTDGLICEKKDFTSQLRQNSVLQPHKNGPTKTKPFNLTEAKKRKREAEYHTLAEQISAFHKKTPERFHTNHKEFQPQEHWNPPKLAAKSPKLQALKRRRVVQAISQEERENQEIEEMKAYEFHARPVDPKIYKKPPTIKPQHMLSTKPKDFRLKTTQRALMQLRNRKESNREKYRFKARPVPKAILNGPTGLKEKPAVHVTEPVAPSFEIENRLEKRKIHEQEKKIQEELQKKEAKKPHPNPLTIVPSVPYVKKRTEIQPFSFDKADKIRFSQKEKKIQEEIEKESQPYVFHAQLMPCPEPSALPVVPKLPPTEVKPFNFLLENRSLKHSDFSYEENRSFKAQPATVLHKDPFIPEKPPKQMIEIKEFNLYSEKRAVERQQLKQLKEEEELEKQQALMLQKAKEEELEHQELIRLRREIVHKANPIRQYKPVELKPSTKPLTQPESPKFETDKRLRSRNESTM